MSTIRDYRTVSKDTRAKCAVFGMLVILFTLSKLYPFIDAYDALYPDRPSVLLLEGLENQAEDWEDEWEEDLEVIWRDEDWEEESQP